MPIDNALHKAAHKGNLIECKKILENNIDETDESDIKIDINDEGASSRRAIHRSSAAGHFEITNYLIQKGADLNSSDNSGRTPLIYASISGHKEIVQLLLENKANVLLSSSSKMTALHVACEAEKVQSVQVIMDFLKGEDEEKMTLKQALTMATNNEEKTAWDLATTSKNRQVCQALKEGGDPNGANASCIIS